MWCVVAIDWKPPNVIAVFDTEEAAKAAAEAMDGLSLRCTAREVTEEEIKAARAYEERTKTLWRQDAKP